MLYSYTEGKCLYTMYLQKRFMVIRLTMSSYITGNRLHPLNYRPVSLTSVRKIIERLRRQISSTVWYELLALALSAATCSAETLCSLLLCMLALITAAQPQ